MPSLVNETSFRQRYITWDTLFPRNVEQWTCKNLELSCDGKLLGMWMRLDHSWG